MAENGQTGQPTGQPQPHGGAATSGTTDAVAEPTAVTTTDTVANRGRYFADASTGPSKRDTARRFSYLLGLTDLFRHFIDARVERDPELKAAMAEVAGGGSGAGAGAAAGAGTHRARRTEKEEDEELLHVEEAPGEAIYEFSASPGYVRGELRGYQIQGLNWLIQLHENNLSGILADEMGLGKTLQTISFLGYLRYFKGVNGPHLVVVPKSTLDNWAREFARWTPEVRVLALQGDKEERARLVSGRLAQCDFDVVLSTYEIVIKEKAALRKFSWQYIVIDEAHRIKNEESLLSQIIRVFHSRNRLLITGTPLQNNLHELWALLNFILPDVFSESGSFDEWFSASSTGNTDVVGQLHRVLKPFLLRRIKSEVEKSLLPKMELTVYCGMSAMQRRWYQKILEKDIDAVNGAHGKKESKTRLLNIVMQLRKCCNHPYLFEGAEPGPPYTTDEHLVFNSQKMLILDQMLKRFRSEGSRVLIFSQMSRLLDILEDYCFLREYHYCRIDGQTDHSDRVNAIDEYNKPGSEKFVFLLTTRAGGLGINLTSADIVILFDSDWNPQADLQAMDRAHRIGQTKQVKVFRFITEHAIEEKVLERATQKLRLDQLVIQQGRQQAADAAKGAASKDELLNMIQYGAQEIFSARDAESSSVNLDEILAASESKTKELNQKYSKLDLSALQNFANDESVYEWNGENFKKKEPTSIGNIGHAWINPGKRERKENYSIDMYYKDVLNPGRQPASDAANGGSGSGIKPPKILTLYDHQFYPAQLYELYELEKNYYKKLTHYKVPLKAGSAQTLEERTAQQKLEQLEIDTSRALTAEERAAKEAALHAGFSKWNRRDFNHFIQVNAKYGRNSVRSIASEFAPDKTVAEVRAYCQAFWQNYEQIEGYERYLAQIEQGEEKIKRTRVQKEALRRKLAQYQFPLQELTLKHPPSTTSKRVFSEEEDRFLLVQLYRFGLDRPDVYERVKDAIRQSQMFRFDFFLQSRNTGELSRRCGVLLACIMKEFNPDTKKRRADSEAASDDSKRLAI